MVSDNGVGLDSQKFKSFLAPSLSYKPAHSRGHKGVGATYLAYGFNFIQVATKTGDFEAVGKMVNARKWLTEENAPNPEMQVDPKGCLDENFKNADKGVSICLQFDKNSQPKNLSWLGASTAEAWMNILCVKTGIGAVFPVNNILIQLTVYDKEGTKTERSKTGIDYLRIDNIVPKSLSLEKIEKKFAELFLEHGKDFSIPNKFKNLDAFYGSWTIEQLKTVITLDEEELEVCEKYAPNVYFCYVCSLKIWESFNQSLGLRKNISLLYGGIQIAANNMPQGETILIPLKRNIGRQNQIHFLMHFSNYSPDMGRKFFQKEIVDFATSLGRKLADGPLNKFKACLRPNTGVSPDLLREHEVETWTAEMIQHETSHPLQLTNPNFFLPTKKISITSYPTREQDVIALFNQLIAGGVIRGIQILSTNERLTYDGLYRIIVEEPKDNHIFNKDKNPLGILKDNADDFKILPFRSRPKILEYKFSLDALIEDISTGDKNAKDIGLAVVWETGEKYKEIYKITSLLDPNNLTLRPYHGVTHVITDAATDQRAMDLIVLKELIEYLNNPIEAEKNQRGKYEEG